MTQVLVETVAFNAFLTAALFLPAGRFDWPMGWACIGGFVALAIVSVALLPRDLLIERSRFQPEARARDLLWAGSAFVLIYPVSLAVCGFDFRFGWSPAPPALLRGLSFAGFVGGYAFSLWAPMSNPFFSTVVRVQKERGHHLVDRGPYALLRHPGYAGALLAHMALPVALGSWWGLLPAAAGCRCLMRRAVEEERVLAAELPGYRDYMQRVRWRMIPRIW